MQGRGWLGGASPGGSCYGVDWYGWLGGLWHGRLWNGEFRLGWQGTVRWLKVWLCMACKGMAGMVARGMLSSGEVRKGRVWYGWQGEFRNGLARLERFGDVGRGDVRLGRIGVASSGV